MRGRATSNKAVDPRRTVLRWLFKTPYTWKADLRGQPIIYWPESKEWSYDGEKFAGDIIAFVRAERESPRLLAETFCFMPADKQAAVIHEIGQIARSWSGGRGEGQWWSIYEYLSFEGKMFIKMVMALAIRKRHCNTEERKDEDKAKHRAALLQSGTSQAKGAPTGR